MRYRGRGRPRAAKARKDLGTKELQQKRAAYETEELLDRYYRLELITEKQYWCGNHFRWLYTLRYGVLSVQSAASRRAAGCMDLLDDDDQWMARMECKYKQAEGQLEEAGVLTAMVHMVIDNQCAYKQATHAPYSSQKLTRALEILVALWC